MKTQTQLITVVRASLKKMSEKMIADGVGISYGLFDGFSKPYFHIEEEGAVEYEFCYINPGRRVSSDLAVYMIEAEDREHPWQPAKIEHLLAFRDRFPEEQRKYKIVAIGSVEIVNEEPSVPYLGMDGGTDSQRYLLDNEWWRRWPKDCRFLAVRRPGVVQKTAQTSFIAGIDAEA